MLAKENKILKRISGDYVVGFEYVNGQKRSMICNITELGDDEIEFLENKQPSENWRNDLISQWLTKKKISHNKSDTKKSLLKKVK